MAPREFCQFNLLLISDSSLVKCPYGRGVSLTRVSRKLDKQIGRLTRYSHNISVGIWDLIELVILATSKSKLPWIVMALDWGQSTTVLLIYENVLLDPCKLQWIELISCLQHLSIRASCGADSYSSVNENSDWGSCRFVWRLWKRSFASRPSHAGIDSRLAPHDWKSLRIVGN